MSNKPFILGGGLVMLLLIGAPAELAERPYAGAYRQARPEPYRLAQWDGGRDRYERTLTCNSKDYRREFCRADIGGRVWLVRQISQSPCIEGRTWGYDERGVWVDQGCQATFGYNERTDDRPGGGGDNVALCQKMVRWEIGKEYGDRADVSFSSGRSYDISRREQAVEGEGVLRTRRDRTRFNYDCVVDRRQNRVSQVNYRLTDQPQSGGGEEAVERCQAAVADRIDRDLGYRPQLSFGPAQVGYPERDRQTVRGEARLRGRRGWDEIRYGCTVDTRRNRVSDVRYDYR